MAELPTDTDLLLEAVETMMGPRFNLGVERGKFQMRPFTVRYT